MSDRKNPEQRATMIHIERLRHSAEHVMAGAIRCHPERSGAKSKDLTIS